MKQVATAGLIAIAALGPLGVVRADESKPFLHPLITNNMILQRGIADPVWGWTTPGQAVSVSFHGKTVKATAGPDGKWMTKIGPFPAGGGPYTLSVHGPQTVTLSNILMGDVWICSGQSNMEFGIGNALNGPAEIAAANYPQIRLFTVTKNTAEEPKALVSGQWDVCTPQTVAIGSWNGFSAVGYFFGRDLHRAIHVPIGLIHTSWGGTPAQAWTSAEALSALPDFQPAIAEMRRTAQAEKAGPTHEQRVQQWYAKNDPGMTKGLSWAEPALDISAWKTMSLPQIFQDAGIPELAKVNGILWFRRTFDLPAGNAGKAAVLHLLADDNDTTWVNGSQVGATEGYNTPRAYKIPAHLLKPTGNVVVVRVLDAGGKGGIWGDPAGFILNFPGGAPLPLSGPWAYKMAASLPADPYPKQSGSAPNQPTALYNGMVSPLVPFGLKGVIWYQGEANSGNARQYQTLLPTLIQDWRRRFGVGDFPFMIVQLANFQARQTEPEESGWAELQEAQLLTSQTVPNTGLAVAVDIGEAGDIHPKNKQEVGRRLSLSAEAIAYGLPVENSGPQFTGMKAEGNKLRLTFSHVGGGLAARGEGGLVGFAIAGADHKYVWAEAKIDGATVLLSAQSVPQPLFVRYAWANNPLGNLYNTAGLPASPFRTDRPAPASMRR